MTTTTVYIREEVLDRYRCLLPMQVRLDTRERTALAIFRATTVIPYLTIVEDLDGMYVYVPLASEWRASDQAIDLPKVDKAVMAVAVDHRGGPAIVSYRDERDAVFDDAMLRRAVYKAVYDVSLTR
jgi:hypothetical protein